MLSPKMSPNPDHLQAVDKGQVVFSASLTRPASAKNCPQPHYWIEPFGKAEIKGYRTRCRIDPIICASNDWEEDYRRLTEFLFERTRVEMITLGQPRFQPPLLNLVRKRHAEASHALSRLPPWHGMEKLLAGNLSDRIHVYRKILGMIDEHGVSNTPLLMVCKEDPAIVQAPRLKHGRCNHLV